MSLIAGGIAFAVLFSLAILGVPLAAAMGLAGVVGMLLAGIPLSGSPIAVMGVLGNFAWLALPLFIIFGGVLSDIGVARGVVWFGEAIGRRVRGGTSQVLIVTSLFMGGHDRLDPGRGRHAEHHVPGGNGTARLCQGIPGGVDFLRRSDRRPDPAEQYSADPGSGGRNFDPAAVGLPESFRA